MKKRTTKNAQRTTTGIVGVQQFEPDSCHSERNEGISLYARAQIQATSSKTVIPSYSCTPIIREGISMAGCSHFYESHESHGSHGSHEFARLHTTRSTRSIRSKLYIMGCPRSMTSFVYRTVVKAMGGDLDSSSDGEILNQQRVYRPFCKAQEKLIEKNSQFWIKGNALRKEILEEFAGLKGFYVMKDVVDPYNMFHWIKNSNSRALIVTKDIPMLAYSLAENDWYYPCDLLNLEYSNENLIKTLIFVYDNYYGELIKEKNVISISNEELTSNSSLLWKRIDKLGFTPFSFDYMDNDFIEKSEKVKEYKSTPLYKELSEIYNRIKNR